MKYNYIACDIETQGLESRYTYECKFLYAHLYSEELRIDEGYRTIEELKSAIEHFLTSNLWDEIVFVFHNASFDVASLRNYGINIPQGRYTDTMGVSYCLEPDAKKSLGELSMRYLNEGKYEAPKFDEYTDELATYCRRDTQLTYWLFHRLYPILKTFTDAFEFYHEIELPYIERIIEMQGNGAYIDKELFTVEYDKVQLQWQEIRKEMRKLVPPKGQGLVKTAFNPNSKREVAQALIKQGWEPTKKTASGEWAVDKDTLGDIRNDYPLAELMCQYSKINIYFKTFLDPIKNKRCDDRIYASFNQFKVRTGRLSSSDPNLQNIPSRDERGKTIRRCFTAPPGYKCVVGDLDRIELVVLAFYLETVLGYNDLSNQIRNLIDVHSSNASRWYAVPIVEEGSVGWDEFAFTYRFPSKRGIFSLVYGAGVAKFASVLGISETKAKELVQSDPLLVAVAQLRKVFIKQAKKRKGALTNFMGRRIFVPELLSKDKSIQASGERKIFNYMIQSTAGDVFKYLQLQAQKVIHEEMLFAKQILVVHDEAMYYVDETLAERVAEVLTDVYTDHELLVQDDIYLPVNCKFNVGNSWMEAK